LLDGVLQDQVSGLVVSCGLPGCRLRKGFFFEPPPRGCRLRFPPLAIFLFQPPAKLLGFSPEPLFFSAPGLLFLFLVPGQTLLHGSLSRFQRPVERGQQSRMGLMALVPELDKRLQCSLDSLAQQSDGL
jgi:hypothetical protein